MLENRHLQIIAIILLVFGLFALIFILGRRVFTFSELKSTYVQGLFSDRYDHYITNEDYTVNKGVNNFALNLEKTYIQTSPVYSYHEFKTPILYFVGTNENTSESQTGFEIIIDENSKDALVALPVLGYEGNYKVKQISVDYEPEEIKKLKENTILTTKNDTKDESIGYIACVESCPKLNDIYKNDVIIIISNKKKYYYRIMGKIEQLQTRETKKRGLYMLLTEDNLEYIDIGTIQ